MYSVWSVGGRMFPKFSNKNSGISAPSALTDHVQRECYVNTGKVSMAEQVCEPCLDPFTAFAKPSTSCYTRSITLATSQHSSLLDNPRLCSRKTWD